MRRHRATRLIALAGSAILALASAAPALAAPPVSASTGPASSSWIVTLAPGHAAPRLAAALTREVGGRIGQTYSHAINGFQFTGSAAAAQALRRNPNVVSVAPDRPIALTAETLPTGVERIAAYDEDTPLTGAYHNGYRGHGARIAVLDTGIDLDHPDLVGSIDQGDSKNCVTPGAPPEDGYGHGTHVSGTAAAPRDSIGVVGVAPEAELVAVKVFDDAGNSSESLVLCGFDHVMGLNADADSTNDIDVMNMSFGEQRAWGDCQTDALRTAVCAANAAGIIMVAGAGNSAVNAGSFVPAAFPEVISVSALTDFDTARGGLAGCKFILELFYSECDDTLALFSNYGASVDVVAPGVFVQSTWPGGTYKTSSGTSMATPHVAGVVALMAAAAPGLTPAQAKANLQTSGECPDGTAAGADASCAGQGTWPDDPDGIPEPMINALRAAVASGNPTAPTAPGAPNLTAANAGNASVALSWTAPTSDGGSPITGYEVWRGTTSGTASLVTPVGLTTTYTDTTVTNGTTYYYRVAAVNAVDTGPGSNERSATPQPPPPPTAPAAPNLTAANAGNASVALSWTAPTSDGGSPITGYEVWRGTTSGTASLVTPVGLTTTYTDTTVTNGTTYYYRVAAVNAVDTGPGSNERSATPTGLVPVTRLGGTASAFVLSNNAGSSSFSLPAGSDRLVAMISLHSTTTLVTSMTWKPDPGNPALDQPLTFVGRQVASASGAVEIWELANPTPGVAGAALSHTLSANAKRVIGVHALAGVGGHGTPVGTGLNGNAISVNVASQPGALVLDVLYGQNSTTAHTAGAGQTMHWSLNASGTNNLRGAGSSEAGATTTTMSWTSGAATHHALLAVSYNPAIPSEPPPPTAPGAPNLTAANAGNASVALSWTAPTSDGGSPITGYEVWRGTTSGTASLVTPVGLTTTYTDTTVTNGTTYYYRVAAVNAVDTGPGSNERSATPQPPPPPTAPAAPNLTAANAGNASVALSWTAPTSDGGSPITGYEVWRGTTSGTASLVTPVGLTTTYTDTTVTNGTTYYYRVAAVNAVDTGPGSNERSATPTGLVPVTRLGGTASAFVLSNNAGSSSFSLPAGSDRLVAMISLHSTTTLVTSMTWKPDPGNPALDQPLTFVGRQVASASGAVEIWELANPTPGVAGAALSHTLSANAKRVIGVHALAGVGGHGTPVGTGLNGNAISVNVASQPGALVLDVLYGQNSTTAHTAGAGQTMHWSLNASGTNNLRGAGSSEAGATTTTMSWTSGAATHHALLAVSYNPH